MADGTPHNEFQFNTSDEERRTTSRPREGREGLRQYRQILEEQCLSLSIFSKNYSPEGGTPEDSSHVPDVPASSLQHLPSPHELQDVTSVGAVKERNIPDGDIPSPGSLATDLAKRKEELDAALQNFFAGLKSSSDEAGKIPQFNFMFATIPMIIVVAASLLMLILSAATPLAGGGSLSLKVAVTILCSSMLVSSLCFVISCCSASWITVLGDVDAEEPDCDCRTGVACIFLAISYLMCLVFVLSTVSTIITSGVFGGSLSPLPSSAMPWVVFVLSLCTCFCCMIGVISTFCTSFLVGKCCPEKWDAAMDVFSDVIAPKLLCVFTFGIMSETCLKNLVYRGKLRSYTCMKPVAKEFVHQQLGIDKDWFAEVKCYCRRCWGLGNFSDSQTRGGKKYAMPRLWTRFALPPVRSAKVRGLDEWHVAYHGTSGPSGKAIIESQRMLMPGDRRPDGGYIEIRPGHVEKDSHATNIFMSPSVTYISCPVYSVEHDCEVQGEKHQVQVALELLIQPETYEVGPETIGAREAHVDSIDQLFSNEELEWFTNRRGVIEVTALLVMVKEDPSSMNDGSASTITTASY